MPTAAHNLFDGLTVDWGFTPMDIWSNGMAIVLSLALFVLLGIAIAYVPKIIELVKTAATPK